MNAYPFIRVEIVFTDILLTKEVIVSIFVTVEGTTRKMSSRLCFSKINVAWKILNKKKKKNRKNTKILLMESNRQQVRILCHPTPRVNSLANERTLHSHSVGVFMSVTASFIHFKNILYRSSGGHVAPLPAVKNIQGRARRLMRVYFRSV